MPIWIAAEGPRMQDLAGRIGDGVIFTNGITEDVVKDNLRRVRAGAIAAGRHPDDVEPWFLVKPHFAASPEKAWHELAWTLSASANHAFRFSLEGKFVPPEHEAGLRRLMDGDASHQHNVKSAGSHNAAIVTDNHLTEFLGKRFLLAGTSAQIVERIAEMADWGATNFIMPLIFGDAFEDAKRLAKEVLRHSGKACRCPTHALLRAPSKHCVWPASISPRAEFTPTLSVYPVCSSIRLTQGQRI